jgi:DNA-binding transcriptional regulator/RsmH inhibitor MraZ
MRHQLSGINPQKVDERNRVALPSRFVSVFRAISAPEGTETTDDGEPLEVVVALGLKKRLCIYPVNVYEEMLEWLDGQPTYEPAWRDVRGMIHGSAEYQTLDKQNRLKIPAFLGRKLGLTGAIVVKGAGRWAELLSEADMEMDLDTFEEKVNRLLSSGGPGTAAPEFS